jgi:hypothetical protein
MGAILPYRTKTEQKFACGMRNLMKICGLYLLALVIWPTAIFNPYKGETNMTMPRSIATWCTILFFLWYGLAAFIPALAASPFPMVAAILALGIAIFTLLGK